MDYFQAEKISYLGSRQERGGQRQVRKVRQVEVEGGVGSLLVVDKTLLTGGAAEWSTSEGR
jgi:hypothetical protein